MVGKRASKRLVEMERLMSGKVDLTADGSVGEHTIAVYTRVKK